MLCHSVPLECNTEGISRPKWSAWQLCRTIGPLLSQRFPLASAKAQPRGDFSQGHENLYYHFSLPASRVRLATLEMSILLLKQLVYHSMQCFLQDRHLAACEGAREESTLLLRNFYKVWEKVYMHSHFYVFFCCCFSLLL